MNAERIEEIRKRAEAATPGPWQIADTYDGAWILDADDDIISGTTERSTDALFISKSREDIPALLAEVDRLRKQNAELLEWNRYYLEVTKERRKEVTELREENEVLRGALMQIAQGDMWTATAEDIAAWTLGLKGADE